MQSPQDRPNAAPDRPDTAQDGSNVPADRPDAVPHAIHELKSLDLEGLEALAESLGARAFRGRQIFRWLYTHGATDFDQMTDLPAGFRDRLRETCSIGLLEESRTAASRDGTVKWLYRTSRGSLIETVLIPDFDEFGNPKRLTVCVSSQVGCAMGCEFCATGRMGFLDNLTSGEIFDQFFAANLHAIEQHGKPVSNIVFMGMGEPLLNYDAVLAGIAKLTDPNGPGLSPRRITVSTVGLAGQIRRLADDGFAGNLAISLHAPTDEKRSAIMPVNRKARTDLGALRDAVQHYTQTTGRIVTYEYCLFQGFNDSPEDADALVSVVRWAPAKVNLIMYNPVEGVRFERSPENRVNRFVGRLVRQGVTVTVRRSRGQDIQAACGQLAAEK